MRRFYSFFISMIMFITSMGICVSADTLPSISIKEAVQLEDKSIYLSGKITNPVENQEVTIIAIKGENGEYNENNSIYVDQQNSIVNKDGTFSLTFNPKVSLDYNSEYIVKVGGTSVENSVSMKIQLGEEGDVKLYFGDSNGDGVITVDDASLALQYVLTKSKVNEKYLKDEDFVKRMNVTGENAITSKQVSLILQRALIGESFKFPVSQDTEDTSSEVTTSADIPIEMTTSSDTPIETTTSSDTPIETTTSSDIPIETTTSSDIPTEATTQETVDPDKLDVYDGILVDSAYKKSSAEKNRYKTINDAINAVSDGLKEETRTVIDIMPGVYREQIVLKKPYITLQKKEGTEGEVKSTWYYGTGSMYDSANEDGFYDSNVIGDGKVNKPKNWGAAFNVEKGAEGTIVKNIVFENSYNEYYTQEELDDGLTFDPDKSNSMFDRGSWIKEQIAAGKSDEYINKWLQSRSNLKEYKGYNGSPRERAAAFHCSADKFEAYNCTFISKQDSMGIDTGREYYENCILSGGVDYICGSATAVFNNCELRFNAGPDMYGDDLCRDEKPTSDSGHIAAPANELGTKGYLFYKCRVTGNENAVPGTFGRPWGDPGAPEAIYYKTKIENDNSGKNSLIITEGWADMSGTKKDEARFYEYGSVDSSGKAVDVSKRVRNSVAPMGTVINEWQVLEFNPYNYTKGTDGWDPMNIAGNYTDFDAVIKGIEFNFDVEGNSIQLPTATNGYEYYWESNSDYAIVNENQDTVSLIRPAYNQEAIDASLTVYIRKSGTEYGVKENIKFKITPQQSANDTFNVSGKVTLGSSTDKDVQIKINFIQSGAVVNSSVVTINNGATEQLYTAKYLPNGEYSVEISVLTVGYYQVTEPKDGKITVSGNIGETKTLNVTVKEFKEITLSTADFTENWAQPTATVSDVNCTAKVVEGSDSLTANIGNGNKVMKFTKKEGAVVKNTVGYLFDLAKAVKDNGGTLANTNKLQFSMDLLLEKDKNADTDGNGYMASDYSLFDFTTKLNNEDKPNQGRYVRYGIHKGWNQLNFFTATNSRKNGNNTQFHKNSTMRNKWYHIVTDVDLKAKTIKTTVYDKASNKIINDEPFIIASPNVDGENPEYPTELVSDALYFAVYMDKKGDTTNRIEFYLDNLELKYYDFK